MLYCSQANAIGLGIVITDALLSTDRDNLRTNFKLVIPFILTRKTLVIITFDRKKSLDLFKTQIKANLAILAFALSATHNKMHKLVH